MSSWVNIFVWWHFSTSRILNIWANNIIKSASVIFNPQLWAKNTDLVFLDLDIISHRHWQKKVCLKLRHDFVVLSELLNVPFFFFFSSSPPSLSLSLSLISQTHFLSQELLSSAFTISHSNSLSCIKIFLLFADSLFFNVLLSFPFLSVPLLSTPVH